MRRFFYGFNEVIMRMVDFIMWCSPLGIAFLIAGKIAEVDRLEEIISKVLTYRLFRLILYGIIHICLFYFTLFL